LARRVAAVLSERIGKPVDLADLWPEKAGK